MKALPDETRTQRTIRDLVALSTLPAIWVNYQPLQVAQSLAEVLQSTLGLDLVYLPGLTHHNSESGLAGKPCLLVKSKLLDHIFATFR